MFTIMLYITYHYTGMRLGFGKNSGKFYSAIDSNPNNTVGSSYLRRLYKMVT